MPFRVMVKGCKKCRGDLYLEQDQDGHYISCIQCSAIDKEATGLLKRHLAGSKTSPAGRLWHWLFIVMFTVYLDNFLKCLCNVYNTGINI